MNTITLDGVTHLVTDSITLEDLRIFIATHPTQLAPTGTPLPTAQYVVVVTAGGKDHRHGFRQEGDARHYYAECVANGYVTALISDGLCIQSTESD